MPRPQSTQIVPTDASRVARPQDAVLQPAAAPVNTFTAPAQDNEFTQLAQGLAAIHEPLARLQHQNDEQARKAALVEAQARAATAADPANANIADLIDRTAPAYRQDVQFAFQDGIGHRLGVQAKEEYLDAYTQAARDPSFNLEQFSADYRGKHLAGLPPDVAVHAASQLDQGIEMARGEQRRLQEHRFVESRNANLSAAVGNIEPEADVTRQMIDFQAAAEKHVAAGGTRAEAAHALLGSLAAASNARGGRPDLFSVFDTEVPGLGMKLADVAGLRDKVSDEVKQAKILQRHTTREITSLTRAEQVDHLNSMLMDGTAVKMGEAAFANHLKQFVDDGSGSGALTSEGYVEHMAKFRQALAVEQDKAYTAQMMASGLGALVSPEKAKPVLASYLDQAGVMQMLAEGIANPKADPALFSNAANAIVQATSRAGVSFADDRLTRVIESVVQEVPKEGADVSPKFAALSRLYAAMERTSKPLLNAHFSDKTRALFSEYNRATVEGQIGSSAAYHQAYAMVDPDNIKLAEERVQKDPVFRAELTDKVRGATRSVFGSGNAAGSLRFLPVIGTLLGGKPQQGPMETWGQSLALNYAKLNPNRSTDDIAKYVEEQTQANWFYEKNSNAYVQVPPALNSKDTQEAISGYLDAVKGNNPNIRPELISKGDGHYTLMFYPDGSTIGAPAADNVSLDSMIALRRAQKGLNFDELGQLSKLRKGIEAGTATAEDIKGSEFAVSKARTLGLWSAPVQRQADTLVAKAAAEKSVTQLEPALRTAMTRGEYNVSAAVKPKGANTAATASQFLANGDLSGALTVMAEGISTVAYHDSKGITIGVGYNMDANAKNIPDDFRKAGIPPEQAAEIKAGQRHITIDQAMRLYQAVKPRYEAAAKSAVETRYPGEWDNLAPNVKAVLTDLAYQTGPAGVKTFKEGLDRLFAGDLSGTGFETTYRGANGERVQDVRRHTLRTAMLRNTTTFQSLLTHAAKQPANALQARLAAGGGT
jgi:GH24 family phage-related lysozyme (muramidase)